MRATTPPPTNAHAEEGGEYDWASLEAMSFDAEPADDEAGFYPRQRALVEKAYGQAATAGAYPAKCTDVHCLTVGMAGGSLDAWGLFTAPWLWLPGRP